MGGRIRGRAARGLPAALAAVAALATATTAGADDPGSLREQAGNLRSANAGLASRERSAVLELYALQSRLARADRRVDELRARSAAVARERADAERHLRLVRATLASAQLELGRRIRALYVEGDPDPLAVLLGAGSLDEALAALDSLDRLARQDKDIVAQVRTARTAVQTAIRSLQARRARLAAVTTEAESARATLSSATSERRAYIASVRRQQDLNAAEIARLTDAAAAAEEKAEEIAAEQAPAPAADPSPEPSAPSAPSAPSPPTTSGSSPTQPPPDTTNGGRTMVVVATGYSLHGTTATGVPTGWGVVAVDPAVIPLGTRMTIPGYGEGVASDTGGAVRGNVIDLWFPTRAQALAWGRRTVTITLH